MQSWFKFNNLELALGENLRLYTSVEKGLKRKVRNFRGLNPTFGEVTGGGFLAPKPNPKYG